jgi:S1-C subfamily serine protease
MRPSQTIAPKRLRRLGQSFCLAALLLTSHPLESQSQPPQRPASASRPGAAVNEMSAEEIFRRFAGRILFLTCDESAETSGLASGVLVSADGFVVTNAHVVEGCKSINATYISATSRRSYEAVLKYYDEKSDTAVLKIADQGLDFFSLPGRAARTGERVYAIGNPRGLEQSISEGIVSGNREEDGLLWIQHSAPISPGSSGGALLSSRGELLGINSFLLRESQNLNFAVPAAMLARALSTARTVTISVAFPPAPQSPGSQAPVGAKANPAEPPQSTRSATAATEYDRVTKYLNLRMYSEAAAVLKPYLAVYEFDSVARFMYGWALQGLKQNRDAAEQLELSLRLDSTEFNWGAFDHLTDVYLAVYEESRANSDRRKAYDTALKMREIQILSATPESERNAMQEAKAHAETVITYLSSPLGLWKSASQEYEITLYRSSDHPEFHLIERWPPGQEKGPHMRISFTFAAGANSSEYGRVDSLPGVLMSAPTLPCVFKSDYNLRVSDRGTKLLVVQTPRSYAMPDPSGPLLRGEDVISAARSLDKICRSSVPQMFRSTELTLERVQ